jgi:hypothetical protein
LIASQLIKYKPIEGEDRFNYRAPQGLPRSVSLPVNFRGDALVVDTPSSHDRCTTLAMEVPVEVYQSSPIPLLPQQLLAQSSHGYGAMRFAAAP